MQQIPTKKVVKIVAIIFLGWLIVTYIPNGLLHKWWFILFIFADFYLTYRWLSKREIRQEDKDYDIAIVSLFILGVVCVVFNRLGF